MLAIYPWQQAQWRRLSLMRREQRLPHALLLSGPAGIGLRQFALAFAMRLLCRADETDRACGQCQGCRLFLANNQPDLKLIEPEQVGKAVKIADIRALIEYVALKSFAGQHKVVIIEPAEAMNRAAANALLKTLEEPPPQCLLLLLSQRPAALPVTIRSRCQRLDFPPVFDQAALDWIRQQAPDAKAPADLLLGLARGAPSRALALLEDGQLPQRGQLLRDLRQAGRRGADIARIAAGWQDYGCENVLITLLGLLEDMARLKLLQHKARLINTDLKEDLQALAKTLDLRTLLRNYDLVQMKYQEANGPLNLNPLSILETVLLAWLNPETTH